MTEELKQEIERLTRYAEEQRLIVLAQQRVFRSMADDADRVEAKNPSNQELAWLATRLGEAARVAIDEGNPVEETTSLLAQGIMNQWLEDGSGLA